MRLKIKQPRKHRQQTWFNQEFWQKVEARSKSPDSYAAMARDSYCDTFDVSMSRGPLRIGADHE